MLTDHRKKQAEWAKAALCRYRDTSAMGEHVAQLAPWSWWATFTFRRMPSRSGALAQVRRYLEQLETAAAQPIESVFLEDFGDIGGRYHFHLLIAGVDHLSSDVWEREACRQFGDCEIKPYDGEQGAAHYVAGKAVSKDRDLHYYGDFERKASAEDFATRASRVVQGSPARQSVSDRDPRTGDSNVSVEKANQRVFVSAIKQPDGNGAAFAWFNEATGKGRVEVIAGANKIEAEYHSCLSALEWVPEGSQIEIVSDSPLLCGQFHDIARVRGHGIRRLRARLMTSIHCQRLDVDVLCVPRSENQAWKLLKRYR
jgi:ribonuclease HI